MTPIGISKLAERARAEHAAIIGTTPAPWHLAPQIVRDAWESTVAMIVAAAKRETANDD